MIALAVFALSNLIAYMVFRHFPDRIYLDMDEKARKVVDVALVVTFGATFVSFAALAVWSIATAGLNGLAVASFTALLFLVYCLFT